MSNAFDVSDEAATEETPLAKAERARDMIAKELNRLNLQLKGIEAKIKATESKLEGADEIVAALKPKKGGG